MPKNNKRENIRKAWCLNGQKFRLDGPPIEYNDKYIIGYKSFDDMKIINHPLLL